MFHTNPLWLGAVCVVLGALLWMPPVCGASERPRPPSRPDAARPTRTYANLGWSPLRVLSCAR